MANQPHNTQELDEAIEDFISLGEMISLEDIAKLKQAILDWHNKQVEEAAEKAFTRGYISGGIDELDRFLKER